jgi:CRP-like cAMP-binding protein
MSDEENLLGTVFPSEHPEFLRFITSMQGSRFEQFTEEEVSTLQQAFKVLVYPKGTPVVKRGQKATFFAVILTGSCRAITSTDSLSPLLPFHVLQPWDTIGEVSFFQPNSFRTADVTCETECHIAVLSFSFYSAWQHDFSLGHLSVKVMALLANCAVSRLLTQHEASVEASTNASPNRSPAVSRSRTPPRARKRDEAMVASVITKMKKLTGERKASGPELPQGRGSKKKEKDPAPDEVKKISKDLIDKKCLMEELQAKLDQRNAQLQVCQQRFVEHEEAFLSQQVHTLSLHKQLEELQTSLNTAASENSAVLAKVAKLTSAVMVLREEKAELEGQLGQVKRQLADTQSVVEDVTFAKMKEKQECEAVKKDFVALQWANRDLLVSSQFQIKTLANEKRVLVRKNTALKIIVKHVTCRFYVKTYLISKDLCGLLKAVLRFQMLTEMYDKEFRSTTPQSLSDADKAQLKLKRDHSLLARTAETFAAIARQAGRTPSPPPHTAPTHTPYRLHPHFPHYLPDSPHRPHSQGGRFTITAALSHLNTTIDEASADVGHLFERMADNAKFFAQREAVVRAELAQLQVDANDQEIATRSTHR